MSDTTSPAAAADLPQPGDLLGELQWRGLIAQSTDIEALRDDLSDGPLTLYCGFDPTAPSLHVGNLVPLLALRRFQDAGHTVVGLVGGATGLIGDPSGRSTERALNDDAVVEAWVAAIRRQLGVVLDFDGASPAQVVSNLEWIGPLSAVQLLREVGKHFSVNQMLAKESVSSRLADEGISFTEFSYMVLQALDYLELYRSRGCRLQIGGADQWGNITAGLDLIRRVEGSQRGRAHALTVPLVTKADGTKFGKTAGGSIWLDPELTSPYAFFQFWVNTDDRDIAAFLRLFSLRSPEEIRELESASAQRPAERIAQRALAEEMTTLVHGAQEAQRVREAGLALFGRGSVDMLDGATLEAALSEAPHADLPVDAGIVDALVATSLCESKSAARRVIKDGGAYVNNLRVDDESMTLTRAMSLAGEWVILRRGKRSIAGVRLTD